ncbi:glycosyltransferase family 2 protein [Chryseobacterium capnotolerans]|uniref:glycosyltransferase family 2 protein n=1 Tax=Chryseobacterium capnotolerans TaxID=2759528 RepID=UPI0024B53632|nr:glycosyltransferase [Chryseobacterium capnotolerans]
MRISVVIPVYNAEKFVSQAVDSVLQFDEVHEIILVEDESPDNALQICQQLAEKHERVKLYQHPDKKTMVPAQVGIWELKNQLVILLLF